MNKVVLAYLLMAFIMGAVGTAGMFGLIASGNTSIENLNRLWFFCLGVSLTTFAICFRKMGGKISDLVIDDQEEQ